MSCHLISTQQDIRKIKIRLNLTNQRGKAKEETCLYLLGPYLIITSSFNKCNRMGATLYFFLLYLLENIENHAPLLNSWLRNAMAMQQSNII